MTEDRGLDIFEEQGDEEAPTQVIPKVDAAAAKPAAPGRPAAHAPADRAAKPADSQASPQAATQAATQSATPKSATTGALPRSAEVPVAAPRSSGSAANLPLVRRGGYDKDAVDQHLRTVSAERAGLTASLNEAQARLKALETQNNELRQKLTENETPSYAGLGGKASEMLRLAEEQAQEVIEQANLQAAEIRYQAEHEASTIQAKAESDADDMRLAQLGELDEIRARTMSEIEAERRRLKADADDHLASARREAEQLRLATEQ